MSVCSLHPAHRWTQAKAASTGMRQVADGLAPGGFGSGEASTCWLEPNSACKVEDEGVLRSWQ